MPKRVSKQNWNPHSVRLIIRSRILAHLYPNMSYFQCVLLALKQLAREDSLPTSPYWSECLQCLETIKVQHPQSLKASI